MYTLFAALTAKVQLKLFVSVKNLCLGIFVYKTCVLEFLSEHPLNMDAPIIRTFWHVPLESVFSRFCCTRSFPFILENGRSSYLKICYFLKCMYAGKENCILTEQERRQPSELPYFFRGIKRKKKNQLFLNALL